METEIVEMRKNGATYKEILSKFDISKDKLRKICRQYKLNISSNRIGFDVNIDDMQDYYNECKSSLKVSKKFNISKSTVLKYIITDKKTKMTDDERKKSKVKYVIDWRKDKKIKLIEYKGGGCEICGYNKSIRSLSFHHKDSNEKDFGISAKSYSYEKLKKEVDKCILVCSNCHGEIHDEIEEKGYSDIVNKMG